MDTENLEAPGWDAIDRALAPLYPGQEPKHFGNIIGYALGGPDPIRGISAYKRLEPVPHWHFVTYGFSELYEKESDIMEESGWGFELTMRLKTTADADEPPIWPLNFLQNLARYVFSSGNVFRSGDYLNANGPIEAGTSSLIRSVAFISDPELPPIETPNGHVTFLQVVGITDDEELAAKQWATLKLLGIFGEHLPLLVTDVDRTSLLELDDVKRQWTAGLASDGSNTGYLFVDQLSWEEKPRLLRKPEVKVTLGARQVREVLGLLPYRLPFGKEFTLAGGESKVVLLPASENGYQVDGATLRLQLRPDVVDEIQGMLRAQEGIYGSKRFPGLMLQVKKTFIKDDSGNVAETIG